MHNSIDVKPGVQTENWFLPRTESNKDPASVPFLLFAPSDYQSTQKRPLLLFLHGYGECGEGDFGVLKKHGPPKIVQSNSDFPFVTVSPQCAPCDETIEDIIENWKANTLLQLVDHVAQNMAIDTSRLYVTGLSMGGFGAWRLVASAPEKFAALLPICSGGNIDWADQIATVPTWSFHGALDEIVGLEKYGKPMVDALQMAGGDVKLTIYPQVGHDSWTRTYEDPEIYDWLLRQRKH